MILLKKLMWFARKRFQKSSELLHFKIFVWTDAVTLRELSIGQGTKTEVPLRSHGHGTLRIGQKNHFGYRPAPRLGSGEILLQPRNANAVIEIGNQNTFSNNVSILADQHVVIGDHCQVGDMVAIYDCDFHELNPATRCRSHGLAKPVHIGNNVWLGSRVMVLKGVSIGDNSVIGAMSVVTRPIPPNCLAAGNPAKVLRSIRQTD